MSDSRIAHRRSLSVGAGILSLLAIVVFMAGCALSRSSSPSSSSSKASTSWPSLGERLGLGSAAKKARTTRVRSELAEHRKQQIERLHAYAQAGTFPYNPLPTPAPVHIFKDMLGTRCAVANLVFLDGHEDLVDRTAAERNDVVVADESSGPLHDWVLTSGLTNEEVRLIQGAGFEFDGNGIVLGEGLPGRRIRDGWRFVAEQERVQSQLRLAEQQLIASTDASLEIATRRFEGANIAMR